MTLYRRLALRHKLLAASIALVVFLTAAMYMAVHFIVMPRLERELIRRGTTIARAVSIQAGSLVITHDQPGLLHLIFEKRLLDESLSYLIVTDTSGRVLAHTFLGPIPAEIQGAHPLAPDKLSDVKLIGQGSQSYYDSAYCIMEGIYAVGTIRVGLSKTIVDDVMGSLHLALLIAAGALMAVAIWSSSRFTRQISRPVSELTRAADEIAKGNLEGGLGAALMAAHGAPPGREEGARDEIELLGESFAHMVRQLQRSNAELRQAYDLRDNLLRSSPDAVVATDEAGRIILFNEGAERLFGYTAAEVLGRLGYAALYPAGVGGKVVTALAEWRRLADFETEVVDRQGRAVQVSLSAGTLYDHGGQAAGTVNFLRDLTERKRMEEEVQRADKLATLGRAVAYVTHEIKNPLVVIGGLAKQVAAKDEPGEREREKLDIIVKEIKRLESILLEIGEYTKTGSPELRPVAVESVVEDVLRLMQGTFEKRHIEAVSELAQNLPTVQADPLKLKQVLVNLVKNAADAMPGGGRLEVATRTRSGHLEISIKDSGPGIPPEVKRQLFKPFFTTKAKGTGLGLSISQQIIERHHGHLRIESEPGLGTECIIDLPLGNQPPA
jgi:histidine kinase